MFTLSKMFGASVVTSSSSVGWNEASSIMTIKLVEDLKGGDRFIPPTVGTPWSFQLDGLKFDGLAQQHRQTGDVGGNPLFEVMLTSPVEILAKTQVIVSSFRGSTSGVPNLINVFGYWESKMGFGGSMVNESGMVWNAPFSILNLSAGSASAGSITVTNAGNVGIMPAIQAITNQSGSFGGPLQFRGHFYNVDLSGLPVPPSYYRTGGVARTILDMVSEICQDGGYDYICYLDGHTIKFKCVSRRFQPAIGIIANFVNSRQDVTSKSVGVELRNDITNAVLIGGNVRQIYQIQNPAGDETIWPFWGFDANNKPIVGTGQPEVWHEVLLDTTHNPLVAGIMGSDTYHCTIPEFRFAMESFDSWSAWVITQEPDKATTINLVSAIDSETDLASIFPDDLFQRDAISANDEATKMFGEMNESDYWTQRAQAVYEFVGGYANNFFGRKFLVKIPFNIYWKVTPETTQIEASDLPCESGYLPEGSLPLGLSYANEDIFLSDDGQLTCFCSFPAANIDLQNMSTSAPDAFVVQGQTVYVKANVDQSIGIIYPGGTIFPYCVVELATPVFTLAPDPLGGVNEIAALFGMSKDPTPLLTAIGERHGDFPVRIGPAPNRPTSVALPIKSNRDSYGPWGTFAPWGNVGVPGGVEFQRDESLTPWACGDVNTMNLTATAKLANLANNMQESESGSVEIAGTPIVSMGDALIAGGPEVTGIEVSIDPQGGVKTSYQMQTFTPRFSAFAKDNADRLRRLGIAAQQIRRSLRALFHRGDFLRSVGNSIRAGFMENTSRAVQQRTPHDILYGRMSYSKTFGYRTQVSAATYPETVANIRGDKEELWQAAAAMSLEGLLRPFSTTQIDGDQPGTGDFPHYTTSTIGTQNVETLNPFTTDCDIDIMVWGDKFPGEMHTIKAKSRSKIPEYDNARLLGLRGPLVVVGWGYEYSGKPFPNQKVVDAIENDTPMPTVDHWDDTFMEEHRSHPEYFKAGPVDLRYDNWRGCWTIPTFLFGVLTSDLSPLGTATMHVSGIPDVFTVHDYIGASATIASGKRIAAGYDPFQNKWNAVSAQC